MFTLESLMTLARHMEWADAAVWRAVLASDAAAADAEIVDRLHHLHMTQRVFLKIWRSEPVEGPRRAEFGDAASLFRWARPYYDELHAWLGSVDSESLIDPLVVPWVRRLEQRLGAAAGPTTLADTVFQVTSHSTYHRGQVNTRLRQLGQEPPLTDYIAWAWYGRPGPDWPAIEGAV